MTLSPFRIAVDDAVLEDLHARLRRTRFTTRSGGQPWQGGVDPQYLRKLVSYWVDGFDWPAQQAKLNELSHYRARIDGRRLHFIHVPGVRPEGAPAGLPLLLSHGWPSSFVEMLPLVDRLTDPARHGADPAAAFDVVVPSLPGFLFSELPAGPLTRTTTAQILHSLMTDVLGHQRYGAFGGDIGGLATGWLGALHPDQVAGIHLIHPPFPASFDTPPPSPAEQAFLDADEAYDETDGGYSAIMGTRPDTLAAALIDSPAGLAAWLIDKYRAWSDNDGELEHSLDLDTILTTVTLYWATGAVGSSFRQYYDFDHNRPRPPITVPAAVTLSTEPSHGDFPREIAERSCTDIRHWSEPGRGGHFMPLEEPDLLAGEMRQFFGALDPGRGSLTSLTSQDGDGCVNEHGQGMTSTEPGKSLNMRAVESAYEAFGQGDLEAFTSLLSEGFVSTQSEAVPWRGSHAGPTGVRSMFAMVGEHAEADYVPGEFIDGGDRIVVIGSAEITPASDGRARVVREVHIWGVERGRLTSLDVFLNAPRELLASLGA